jgi:hypothetical protein
MQNRFTRMALWACLLFGGTAAYAQAVLTCPAPAPPQPLSSVMTQMGLTPVQQTAVQQVAATVHRSLMVTLYPIGETSDQQYLNDQPITVSVDQLLSRDQAELQRQMARRHPDPIAVQALTAQIALYQSTRYQVIAAADVQLAFILYPTQQQQQVALANWFAVNA